MANTYTQINMHVVFSVKGIVRVVKTNLSKWINENRFIAGKFS
jgi:hypothetical protein